MIPPVLPAPAAVQPLERWGGRLGRVEVALHEIEPALPEARVGQVDADDRAELLGAVVSRRRASSSR